MTSRTVSITSLSNPRVKEAVKLRQRSHRDELGLMLIEGYRELKRSLDNKHNPSELFFCRDYFQGGNEDTLVERCTSSGALLYECSKPVFDKMAYRDRPEGLLAIAPQIKYELKALKVPKDCLVIIAEAIEKPGNLGTILRSSDAAGVHAVIVCDRCTDINNPNVVRASIGTLFSIPVIETTTEEAMAWLTLHGIQSIAATPHAKDVYSQVDMKKPTAIILGTEQYGLSEKWLKQSTVAVQIPMLGQCDSLNVAAAATILIYEAARQRGFVKK